MFHWICPECGREIPPSVRECPACDPNAPAVNEPLHAKAVEPIAVSTPPVVETTPPMEQKIEAAKTIPVVEAVQAGPEPKIEQKPIVEAAPVQTVSAVAPEPLNPPALAVAIEPPPVPKPEPSESKALPVEEAAPAVEKASNETKTAETKTVETAPAAVSKAEPPALPKITEPTPSMPVAEAAPVKPELSAEPIAVETAPAPQISSPASVAKQEQEVVPPVVAEPKPAAETKQDLAETSTVAAPKIQQPATPPTPQPAPSLDPLLALAEEIRAVQAARAAALASSTTARPEEPPPPAVRHEPAAVEPAPAISQLAGQSTGLLELAGAVGVPQSSPQEEHRKEEHKKEKEQVQSAASVPPKEHAEPAAPVVAAAPVEPPVAAARSASTELSAVALLTPPEPAAPEPVALEASTTPAVPLVETKPQKIEALAPEPESKQPPQAEPIPEPQAAKEPQVEAEPSALQPPALVDDGPVLALAPLQNYSYATSRSIQPVAPRVQILMPDSGPRITLPGPTLPPELNSLQDANIVTVIGEQTAQRAKVTVPPPKGRGIPGWLVSTIVGVVLLSAMCGAVFYFSPNIIADAKPATPAAAAPAPTAPVATPAPQDGSQPLSKLVEVTGFRFIVDPNKKSEVQYLVVNHSAAELSDINIFVTLRSANAKPGQAPLCRFSFRTPSLGAFESKEMSSPIEKLSRAVTLPDWQDLRPEVQIAQ